MTKNEKEWLKTYLENKAQEILKVCKYYAEHGDFKEEHEAQQVLYEVRNIQSDILGYLFR